MKTDWKADLSEFSGPLHSQLVAALHRDVDQGQLIAGERLPTHRQLARSLGLGIGTVTRAYAEAEQLGLITSQVGRGTFVAPRSSQTVSDSADTWPIDLSMNIQTLAPAAAKLPDVFRTISQRGDLAKYAQMAP